MIKTFDMRFIRYINLFGRITKVTAKHSFMYNNMIIFVVPKHAVERAIGKDNSNLKRLSNIIGRRIRVIAEPRGKKDIKDFISMLVSPVRFQSIEVKNDEIIITAGEREAKAMLIGRERAREKEMEKILEQYFRIKNVRIL